jgi:ketosteroid isomerase-like protein
VVSRYLDGFRRTDHDQILGCLHDDVEWVLHGYKTLHGKAAFDEEIENDAAVGPPRLELDQLVEEADTVVAVGHGQMTLKDVGDVPFVFTEIFTFDDELISRIETFHINIPESADVIFGASATSER